VKRETSAAGVGDGAGIGTRFVRLAQILDAGLEELVGAVAALAEHLAEVGIAARCADIVGDMGAADRNGEFGPQAQAFAGFGFGQEDPAAKILAGHVEKRLGRLDHRDVDAARIERVERTGKIIGDCGKSGLGQEKVPSPTRPGRATGLARPSDPHKGEGLVRRKSQSKKSSSHQTKPEDQT
jgi:hypothetical protein